jgi:hypothetical protein
MYEHKKKSRSKKKYPPIPAEFNKLMKDEFWSQRVPDLIELIDDEIELLHSENSFDLILQELAFYRVAYRLEILQVKSKATASQEKRLIAIKNRDQHAEVLFQAAVEKIKGMDEKVTYKTLVRELDKMKSPMDGYVVYFFAKADKKPDKKLAVVSNTFLTKRLTRFNVSGN